MDASTAVCFNVSCGGAAFGKICLKDVNKRSSGVVGHSLVPPVEELLGTRGSILEVINDKPVEGLVVESIVDLTPLGSGLECKVKLTKISQ